MSTALRPFNPTRACSKCGHTSSVTVYRPSNLWRRLPDRLERTCCRCNYEWHEAPLDAITPTPPPAGDEVGEEKQYDR